MRIKILVLTAFMAMTFLGQAQSERFRKKGDSQQTTVPSAPQKAAPQEPESFTDRLVYGGNVSLSFGTNTFIYLAPTVAYKFSDRFLAGPGFIYQYASFNQAYNVVTGRFEPFNFESQIYGPKAMANFFVNDYIYLGSQFEYLNHDVVSSFTTGELTRQWTSVLFLEVGYLQRVGGKGFVQLGFRYNVLHDFDSPYAQAWMPSIGFFF